VRSVLCQPRLDQQLEERPRQRAVEDALLILSGNGREDGEIALNRESFQIPEQGLCDRQALPPLRLVGHQVDLPVL